MPLYNHCHIPEASKGSHMTSGDWRDPRPRSPHLQVWKWHATLAASISHRFTGAANYFGAFLIAAWVFALGLPKAADGSPPAFYQLIETVITSIPGQIILVLWAATILYHFANGIRHLLWDGPRAGFSLGTANAVSIFNFVFAIAGAIGIWAAATFI